MESRKIFVLPHKLLIALLLFTSTLCLSFVIPTNFNLSQIIGINKPQIKIVSSKTDNQQRVAEFQIAMEASLNQQLKQKNLLSASPTSFDGKIIYEIKPAGNKKVIALTFDDGPWKNTTRQTLDILKKNNIKGTFFVVGQALKNNPQLGKQIITEGHAIANHTWHHWYHFMNPQVAAFEIDKTTDLIYQVTGVKTNLFRPPGGHLSNGLVAHARNKKYATLMWSADSRDFQQPAPATLVNNVIKNARPGGIVLLHDGGGDRTRTIQALPQIIAKLKQQGYSFVTIPELLEMEAK
ncbi:polysaccharide deacetylase family protein [Plectonema cf. radiosum LEGE 06105]|uniref:Polysaccharide deacetylase family protein n=1 Tax=Plectonema cf. radiosum LEGE 06105 TaxID=945769 RepID=A0A8J7K376_9CYAN|nr:polysaccharide deacetylase family protein [Plectonema radiosum]MBE9215581.1 polysaccharide deacetylase family protein [Plectonema cf. radiosum LEGE 06105]